jgi:catalase
MDKLCKQLKIISILQVMTPEEAKNLPWNPFDATKVSWIKIDGEN